MKAGAIEFLSKPFDPQDLLRAVEAGIERDRAARDRRLELLELEKRYGSLTPREQEVLPYVVAGYANKQSAGALGVAEITIGVHRGHIMRKMAARSLAELIRMAEKLSIAPVPEPLK